MADVHTVVRSGMDRELLKLFRDESTTCVLLVRVANEQRKEEWKAKILDREAMDAELQAALDERVIDTLFNQGD